jgi:predicted secreted Zn-dependent protease
MKPDMRVLTVATAIIWLVSASAAVADDAEIVYYDIVGDSAKELRSQLNGNGPVGKGGKRSDGRADWHVTWNFRYAPSTQGCKLTVLKTTVTGRIVLPRWKAGHGASNALVGKWERYISALRVHEEGHYAFGVRAADEISDLRQSASTANNCSELVIRVNTQARAILEKYKNADDAYDASTKHGRTQGAVFP